MKKLFLYLIPVLVVAACDSYLDVNTNTNQATTVTPNLILPQALVATALNLNGFNSYGAQIGGYAANAGGYGGFNELVSYKYTSSNYNGLWSNTYDNLEDYQYIITSTAGSFPNLFYNAAATIMRVYNFQLLVDTYNDIPYSQALTGSANLTPIYDKGSDIYPALAVELDSAIARIKRGLAAAAQPTSIKSYDPLFSGDMSRWLQLANTLKLRLMIRANGKVAFTNSVFDAAGFLTSDALINPGYTRDVNRQNPKWNNWAFSYTGAAGTKSWIPTTWIMSFYNGINLLDTCRGKAIYFQFKRKSYGNWIFGDSISNQLGREGTDIPACPTGSFWYSGTDRGGTTAGNSMGILKGPNAGMSLFTAAESYFLQAEAAVIGLPITGYTLSPAGASFNNGITASFKYLYSLPDGSQPSSLSYSADASRYISDNLGNHLVDFTAAVTPAQQIEAIITQKYIALNFINSQEGWNEYRRTGYPLVAGTGATTTFASVVSQSTRPDRLPSRILYPTTESAYNPANVPANINTFTSLIFWAK